MIIMIVSSRSNLLTWIDSHMGDGWSAADHERVADTLLSFKGCPDYGDDWSDFLGQFEGEYLMEFAEAGKSSPPV